MKPGDVVRMNAACKRALFKTHSHDHVREFGRCHGVVEGLTDYGSQRGPEWDVRWQPSNLRYAYPEEYLASVSLKAFYVEMEGEWPDDTYATLVYAYTALHARELGANDLSTDYEAVKAWRVPQHDTRATKEGAEHDARYLRELGWGNTGELRCDSCGLFANGLEEHAVCRMCRGCKECGCEEDCDQSEGFSCE